MDLKKLFIGLAFLSVAGLPAAGQTRITTAEELAEIGRDAASLRGRYVLENDLTVEDWTPVGTVAAPFLGVFDGQGHTVTIASTGRAPATPNRMRSGADIPQVETVAAGLFGMTGRRSVVQNVKVEGEIVAEAPAGGNVIVGGVAGLSYGVIQNCASAANIRALADSDGGFCIAGGVVGVNNSTLCHAYSTGDVEADGGEAGFAGGIAGINDFDAGVIRFCYAAGRISAPDCAGGIAGLCARGGTIDFCATMNESITVHFSDGSTGRIAGENSGRIGRNIFSRRDMALTDDPTPAGARLLHEYASMRQQDWWMPQTRIASFPFGSTARAPWAWNATASRPAFYWEQGVTTAVAQQRGRAAEAPDAGLPVEIHTEEELAAVNDALALKRNYVLMADLTLENWTPLGRNKAAFTGTFDGNGHTVTILSFNRDSTPTRNAFAEASIGLFSATGAKSAVRNLRIKGDLTYDSGTRTLYMGAVAGINGGRIVNCLSEANIDARGGRYTKNRGLGQMMLGAASNGIITYVNGAFGGGIAGLNNGSIENCYATGEVAVGGDGFKGAGGIVGRNCMSYDGAVAHCYATGNVSARDDVATRFAGGVVGLNFAHGTVNDCVALGARLEAVGKRKGMTITGWTLGVHSNFALGAVGFNLSVGSGINYHEAKSKNAFYSDRLVIHAETEDDGERENRNEDPTGWLARQQERGDRVKYAVMQQETWWQTTPRFPFGSDDDRPWVWNAEWRRPALYWETEPAEP